MNYVNTKVGEAGVLDMLTDFNMEESGQDHVNVSKWA